MNSTTPPMQHGPSSMHPTYSTFLDLLRFAAALLVFGHHFAYDSLTGGSLAPLGVLGEDAVMIFFVLSGYVIAFVLERERSLQRYAVNRLSRLYSVVIPALLFTVIADGIGKSVDPALYQGIAYDSFMWLRTIVSLAFANQFWSFDVRFLSNGPYWSISYEFWFYVFFAIAVFTAGRLRLALFALWAVMVGPLIVLLLPVWLMGVAVHRLTKSGALTLRTSSVLFVLPIPLYCIYLSLGLGEWLTSLTDVWVVALTGDIYFLHKARFFLHDYVVGALVAVQLAAAHGLAMHTSWTFGRAEPSIRTAAGYTFSLYLYHVPALYCLAALSPWYAGHPLHAAFLALGTAGIVLVLAPFTEAKKNVWRHAIHQAAEWLRERLIAVRARPPAVSLRLSQPFDSAAVHTGGWLSALLGAVLLATALQTHQSANVNRSGERPLSNEYADTGADSSARELTVPQQTP